MTYIEPKPEFPRFTCPTCSTVALQRWSHLLAAFNGVNAGQAFLFKGFRVALCDACENLSVWKDAKLVFPVTELVVEPNTDMPESVRLDFCEALKVYNSSPKACAALLRLAIQRCCVELGLKGENLNNDIGELIVRGLPEQVRKSLDIVRVIGNNAVHPGVIDVNDDPAIARTLLSWST